MAIPVPKDTPMTDLWAAFPIGYFPTPGTSTVGGQQVVRGKDGAPLWYWPEDAKFSKPGLSFFDEERPKLWLLPDLTDDSTWVAVLRLLGTRTNIDGSRGIMWTPKATETRDRARMSVGKTLAGWTLRTVTRQVTFPLPGVKDEATALLKALKMTACACNKGLQRECPQHGETRYRPWK